MDMIIEVWFNDKKVKTSQTIEDTRDFVYELAKSKKSDIPYYRYWENNKGDIVVDYGSHIDFIYIKGVNINVYLGEVFNF